MVERPAEIILPIDSYCFSLMKAYSCKCLMTKEGAFRLAPKCSLHRLVRFLLYNDLYAIEDVDALAHSLEAVERCTAAEQLAVDAIDISRLSELLNGGRNVLYAVGLVAFLLEADGKVIVFLVGIEIGTKLNIQVQNDTP